MRVLCTSTSFTGVARSKLRSCAKLIAANHDLIVRSSPIPQARGLRRCAKLAVYPGCFVTTAKLLTRTKNTQTCTCFISITVRQKTTCHRLPPRVATRSLYSVRLGCCCTHYMQHNDNHHCLVPRVDPMMSLTKLSRQF